MMKKWINMQDEIPKGSYEILVRVEVPCYFDCSNGKALTAYVEDKYVTGTNYGLLYAYPIDLTNTERHWKWKLNKKNKKHYEDVYSWAVMKQSLDVPKDYHYYDKNYKNTLKTFEQELPAIGTSIILRLEMRGRIEKDGNDIVFERDDMHFMCSEMQADIRIDLSQKDIVWKWQ